MRKLLAIVFVFFCLSLSPADAGVALSIEPGNSSSQKSLAVKMLRQMNTKEIQLLIGRKLRFKEKAGLFIIKHSRLLKAEPRDGERVTSKKGKAAFILGLCAFGGLLVPFVGILSVPAAILAIIFGSQAVKTNKNDRQGRTGMILGIVFLASAIFIALLVIAIISAFTIR